MLERLVRKNKGAIILTSPDLLLRGHRRENQRFEHDLTRPQMCAKLAIRTKLVDKGTNAPCKSKVLPASVLTPYALWFLYYKNVPNEFAGACVMLLSFRRGRGDEFLEAEIVPEGVEHWIEPEQRRSERHVFSQWTTARHRE